MCDVNNKVLLIIVTMPLFQTLPSVTRRGEVGDPAFSITNFDRTRIKHKAWSNIALNWIYFEYHLYPKARKTHGKQCKMGHRLIEECVGFRS